MTIDRSADGFTQRPSGLYVPDSSLDALAAAEMKESPVDAVARALGNSKIGAGILAFYLAIAGATAASAEEASADKKEPAAAHQVSTEQIDDILLGKGIGIYTEKDLQTIFSAGLKIGGKHELGRAPRFGITADEQLVAERMELGLISVPEIKGIHTVTGIDFRGTLGYARLGLNLTPILKEISLANNKERIPSDERVDYDTKDKGAILFALPVGISIEYANSGDFHTSDYQEKLRLSAGGLVAFRFGTNVHAILDGSSGYLKFARISGTHNSVPGVNGSHNGYKVEYAHLFRIEDILRSAYGSFKSFGQKNSPIKDDIGKDDLEKPVTMLELYAALEHLDFPLAGTNSTDQKNLELALVRELPAFGRIITARAGYGLLVHDSIMADFRNPVGGRSWIHEIKLGLTIPITVPSTKEGSGGSWVVSGSYGGNAEDSNIAAYIVVPF
ncbi:hypothetical protein J4206_00590 [Candidatus Woesearchaeota archaeon]|nr:hypothetical protein [Candidatus Woesearchaeota archaeon]